ncbi:MAG: YlxR family protein [Oscillospiraceae bacterium]|nr:YlxR family protein [Oscillospiraceae bacterium]
MQRKIPMRQCVGCRTMRPKSELLRIVRSPEGEVTFDPTGKKAGRGAYICKNPDCLKKAIKSRGLSRAFEAEIPDEVFGILSSGMEAIK